MSAFPHGGAVEHERSCRCLLCRAAEADTLRAERDEARQVAWEVAGGMRWDDLYALMERYSWLKALYEEAQRR